MMENTVFLDTAKFHETKYDFLSVLLESRRYEKCIVIKHDWDI